MQLTTQTKVRLAAGLARLILVARALTGRGSEVAVVRRGIRYQLDLREGIDLALYLGVYQTLPRAVLAGELGALGIVMDVGANIGAHTLALANRKGAAATVVAVEPTEYAYGRLAANLALNPDLEARVVPVHAGLGPPGDARDQTGFYSRWPLVTSDESRHPKHRGVMEATGGARFTTLDALMEELAADGHQGPLSFLKIDVDGNELSVLQGAAGTLSMQKPVIFMEMAPYVQDEVPGRLEELVHTLSHYGYAFLHPVTGERMAMEADSFRRLLPDGAALDLLAWAS